ncbi:MAG: lipoate--protein ligase family protein [Verrucomicrobia bacterium]|jgi:lipoate---protein ligase|nr:lipoate--protein ligase family protein [Verrucomicrobiota bacterium]
MKYLDLTFPSPEENLACDEALIDQCEVLGGPGVLRFWESQRYFVVVGYSNRNASEVNLEACRLEGIPVLRRCTGGGTVLQGPGCLNYALVLPIVLAPDLATVTGTNTFVMLKQRDALASLLGSAVCVQGHTDLALGPVKFSGNAQRRKRSYLLFHGTFLINLDLSLVGRLLRFPSRAPEYRRERSHGQFLSNIPLSVDSIQAALRSAWNAADVLESPPLENVRELVETRYARDSWNVRS